MDMFKNNNNKKKGKQNYLNVFFSDSIIAYQVLPFVY
jgi:hypothetical protein